MNTAYCEAFAIYASPSIPLGIGWWRALRSQPVGTGWVVPAVATISLAWLLVGSLFPTYWGPSYGHLRSAIIDGNFVAMLLAAVAAFSSRLKLQTWTGSACLMLALVWAFVASINATI